MPSLSVVLPAYNEAGALKDLLPELRDVLDNLGCPYEVVLVDDGSTDQTSDLATDQAGAWSELQYLQLRSNAGQTAALQAGFDHATGEVIATLDADGQNHPGDLPGLLDALSPNVDLVQGRRLARSDPLFSKRLPSMLANHLIRFWTGSKLHDQGCSLRVFRSELLTHQQIYGEQHRYLGALLEGRGARVVEMDVRHRPRNQGRSHYGWSRLPKVLLDLLFLKYILSYSSRPLHLFGGGGLLASAAGTLACLEVTVEKFARGVPAAERPLLLLGVLLILMGVVMVSMGVLAELLVRNYHEIARIPTYQLRHPASNPSPPSG